jgi:electron transfer flavoprotein alpha subunit
MIERILIIVETDAGQVMPVTYELLSLAQAINPTYIEFLVLGTHSAHTAAHISRTTGRPVLALTTTTDYSSELWMDILSRVIPERRPDLILAAQTASGQDFAPGLAIRLGAACITAVQGFARSVNGLVFTRAILNGKALMDIIPGETLSILTVQPGAFAVYNATPPAPGPVEHRSSDCSPRHIIPTGMTHPAEEDAIPLSEAETIVAAGRGIGKPENLELIERLSARFTRAAVGGSRPLCDLGWLAYRQQVGLTGKTVAPKLYIACGISGSPQHIAGMKNAQLIIAINKDPRAAIFQVAHYGIVADLLEFIPLLLEELERD